jgi:hypothetical protein
LDPVDLSEGSLDRFVAFPFEQAQKPEEVYDPFLIEIRDAPILKHFRSWIPDGFLLSWEVTGDGAKPDQHLLLLFRKRPQKICLLIEFVLFRGTPPRAPRLTLLEAFPLS